MIRLIKMLVLTLTLALFVVPNAALAATDGKALNADNDGTTQVDHGIGVNNFANSATEAGGLSSTLRSVTHFAMYVFYLLGIIFMGIAAVKFKNGDMEAMGKNFGGSVILFLVPKIIEVILAWAAQ